MITDTFAHNALLRSTYPVGTRVCRLVGKARRVVAGTVVGYRKWDQGIPGSPTVSVPNVQWDDQKKPRGWYDFPSLEPDVTVGDE
jgi:hypothetical protein